MYLNRHKAQVMRLTRWARSLQNAIACPHDRLILSGKPTNFIRRFLASKGHCASPCRIAGTTRIFGPCTPPSRCGVSVASWLQAASCVQSKFQEASHG